ncbi:MAG: glycosyltransferase family 4 protein [Blastochloris sp.]|nr:glycosyltransferase family 4 protein [Blastochloris sp.]
MSPFSHRLAIVTSHPIQYYAPWFRSMTQEDLNLNVFYLWNPHETSSHDPGFQRQVVWDVPLLEGYPHEFIPNTSPDPGTHHPAGLQNPELISRLRSWKPSAVLMLGFHWDSMRQLIQSWQPDDPALILRGDSHDLARPWNLATLIRPWISRFIFRHFQAFLSCGTANTQYFLHRGARQEQIFPCPHAINMDHFRRSETILAQAYQLRQSLGLRENQRLILFAGKFEPKKRPLDLVKAFQSLNPRDAALLFVGSGELEQSLHNVTEKDPRIHILPFTNQSAMPSVYVAADLFVLPSFGPSETWGLAVQESLACGTPVLVSHHAGCISIWF